MKSLCDQLTTLKCNKHRAAYCYIYKGIILPNQTRMMCDQCANRRNFNDLINIRDAFEYLHEIEIQDASSFKQKAMMWQEFKHFYDKIVQLLRLVEHLMEGLINSIFQNEVMTLKAKSEKEMTNDNIESIGQYLSNVIDTDNVEEYCLVQDIELSRLNRQNQYKEVINVQKQTIRDWNQLLDSLKEEEQNNYNRNQMEQGIIQRENIQSYTYETSQTLLLNDICSWLCLSRNETQLVAANRNSIVIFNLSQQGQWIQGEFPQQGHTDMIRQVRFNHNSTLIVSCGDDKQIIIWKKLRDAKWIVQFKLICHTDKAISINFNYNSKLLASGSCNGIIYIHALNNDIWELQEQLVRHTQAIREIYFNQDASLLASAGNDKMIIVWQLTKSGKQIVQSKLNGHTEQITGVQFSSDSKQLVSSSWDLTIKIWEVDRDKIYGCIHTLYGHNQIVSSLHMNRVSNIIVSGSNDFSIKVWKLNEESNWECIQSIEEHY